MASLLELTGISKAFAGVHALKGVSFDLRAGKGLAGTVLQNEELATNVQLIAANLAITSSNLNRQGLWGILWSHKPPATNATGRAKP